MELSNETLLALVHFCPSFIPLLRQISSPRRNSWRNKALPALLRRYLLSFDYATRQRIPSSFLCRPQDPPPCKAPRMRRKGMSAFCRDWTPGSFVARRW